MTVKATALLSAPCLSIAKTRASDGGRMDKHENHKRHSL